MAKKLTDKQKSMLGSGATGLTSGIGLGASLAQIEDTSADEAFIEGVGNTQFAGDYDSLMNSFDATNMARTNYTADEIRGFTPGQMAGSIIGNTAASMLGSNSFLEAGVRGATTFAGGIFGALVGNVKAQKRATELNSLAEENNKLYLNNFTNAVSNTQNKMFNNSLLNLSAYGGPLFNHGGDWSNGLTFINEGGTHEQNPFGGVPVGVDQEGTPNLVEEGEIIWNDYVFSNRLKPTKKQLETAGFDPKYEGWTFAKIVEDIQKVSAENPLDKISTDTLNENLMYLMTMQEEIRMKKEAKKNKFDLGGPTDSTAVAIRNLENQIAEEQYYKHLGYPNAEVGKRIQKEQKYTKAINSLFERLPIENTLESILSKFSKKEKATGRNKKESDKFKYGGSKGNVFVGTGEDPNLITYKPILVQEELAKHPPFFSWQDALKNPKVEEIVESVKPIIESESVSTEAKMPWWQSAMRYASPLMHGITLLNNLKKPDYSNADNIERAARAIPGGSYTPLGNTLDLDLVDRNVYTNPMLANAAANRRAIMQNSANAGSANAALLANNSITNNALGLADIQGTQANNEIKSKIAQFDLTRDQANSQMGLQALAMDQQRAQNILNATSQAGQLRSQLDAARSQAISSSLTGIADDLGSIGREASDRYLMEKLIGSGALQWTKAKNGGMLTRNRRRK